MRKKLISAFACLLLSRMMLAGDAATDIASFEALIQSGNYVDAQTKLESYTAEHPDSWRAQYQLGYVYFRQHRIQQSVTLLCKSLILNNSFAESHKILAYDLNILGHQDLAITELEQAIHYDSQSAESQYELGRIYYEQGAYVDSIAHLTKAKLLSPDSVRVYHNLGLAYAAISDNTKAVSCFEEGLKRNLQQAKPSAWPLIDYATYFNLQGSFEKARAMLLEAIQIDSSVDQEFEELSKAYRGLGQTTEAIAALKHAVALNPQKAELHYVLARLYTKTNRQAEAEAELAEYQKRQKIRAK